MKTWRGAGARGVVGLAVVAAMLGATSPAGAGHINKGEGHGGGATINFFPVVVASHGETDCRFSMRFSIEVTGSPN